MALDINGYNDTFKAFADFAAQATKAPSSPSGSATQYFL